MTQPDLLRPAWDRLVDEVASAFTALDGATGVTDDVDVAEGARHVLRVLDAQLELCVESGDRRRPRLLRLLDDTRKFFFDNPDATYDTAAIRGDRTYRLHGVLGDADYVSVCVYGRAGGRRVVATVSDADLHLGDGRHLDLLLGGDPPGSGDWLRLEPDADTVVVRQYFTHDDRREATLSLDPVDPVPPAPPLTGAALARRLDAARQGLAFETGLAVGRNDGSVPHPNRVVLQTGGGVASTPFGTPDNAYVGIWFHVDPGEALVIEGVPPESRYWGIQVLNRWGESLDGRVARVSRHPGTTRLSDDGRYRFVLAHTDPAGSGATELGDADLLELAGHREGFVLLRWMQCVPPEPPSLRVVPLDGRGARVTPGVGVTGVDEHDRAALHGAVRRLLTSLRHVADHIDRTTADDTLRAERYRAATRSLSELRRAAVEEAGQPAAGRPEAAPPLSSATMARRLDDLADQLTRTSATTAPVSDTRS